MSDTIVTLPVDPAFPSLNIAHAVLVVAYEWRLSALAEEADALPFRAEMTPPAAKADLVALFEHLESALDASGFFRPTPELSSTRTSCSGGGSKSCTRILPLLFPHVYPWPIRWGTSSGRS